MRGLIRDIVLIAVTAVGVTAYQGYAKEETTQEFTLTCQTGRIVVTDYIEHAMDDAIILGMDIRGQVSTLEHCTVTVVTP